MINNISNGEDGLSVRNKLNAVIGIVNTPIVNNPVDNHLVTSNGTTGTINSETNITFNGTTLDVTGNIVADKVGVDINVVPVLAVGEIGWDDADGTLEFLMKGGNVTHQIGQETVVRVVNKTSTNISLLESNYQAVRITGAQGQRVKVDLAQATNDVLSAETIGLVTETIPNNQEGFITTSGLVRGINTTGSLQGETWLDGDILYLSPTIAGQVTKIKPVAPNHLIIIGYVVSAHITQGTIFVKVDNGYELDELHNVKITGALNNQALIYNQSTDIWENKNIDSSLNYKVYTALITHNNTLAPTAIVLQNTFGFTFSFTRTAVGSYAINIPDGFIENKTTFMSGGILGFVPNQVVATNPPELRFNTRTTSNVLSDSLMNKMTLEIKFYN